MAEPVEGARPVPGSSRSGTPHGEEWVRVFGPSSLSNLGPGYDAIGLCIGGIGDIVEARRSEKPGVRIVSIEGDGGLLPRDASKNTASLSAQVVLDTLGVDGGLEIRISKQVPFGSGIGGSSASAVAGAWAANAAYGTRLAKEDLVEAVLFGEEIASGGRHGDNVLPALFGGLVLVSPSDAARYRQIELVHRLHLALLLPEVQILTKQAREMLPKQVSLRDAVHNAAELAFLVDAFHRGDWETAGRCIMADRLVEPVRATLVPCYEAVREAAVAAGALGCALTGSGPAMFALVPDAEAAARVRDAMVAASVAQGVPASGLATQANPHGVTCCPE